MQGNKTHGVFILPHGRAAKTIGRTRPLNFSKR